MFNWRVMISDYHLIAARASVTLHYIHKPRELDRDKRALLDRYSIPDDDDAIVTTPRWEIRRLRLLCK